MTPPFIASPLHIMHLSTPETPQPTLFKDTEIYSISTPYYSASIPIWRDSLPTTPASISAWKEEWSAPEAGEVVHAVGAWVLCFRKARTREDLEALRAVLGVVGEVVESHTRLDGGSAAYGGGGGGGGGGDEPPLLLAVGMQQSITPCLEMGTEEWEDVCRDCGGWEWVDGTIEGDAGMNDREKRLRGEEEGEDDVNGFREKVGMARLKEALEAHEWEGRGGDDDDDFENLDDLGLEIDDDDASLGFGEEATEAQMEMWGMQSAVRGVEEGQQRGEEAEGEEEKRMGKIEEGEEQQRQQQQEEERNEIIGDQDVQELEAMMLKMQAVRDMGADMPEKERKRYAAKAVRDVLKKM